MGVECSVRVGKRAWRHDMAATDVPAVLHALIGISCRQNQKSSRDQRRQRYVARLVV